ncbi:unnamed protein product [Closterium sp. NIES-53]
MWVPGKGGGRGRGTRRPVRTARTGEARRDLGSRRSIRPRVYSVQGEGAGIRSRPHSASSTCIVRHSTHSFSSSSASASNSSTNSSRGSTSNSSSSNATNASASSSSASRLQGLQQQLLQLQRPQHYQSRQLLHPWYEHL